MSQGKHVRYILAAVLVSVGSIACSNSSNMQNMSTENAMAESGMQVELVRWDDAIEVSYTFTNTTDADVIVFDAGLTGLNPVDAILLEDGVVRLFRGRHKLVGVAAVSTPLIEGRLVKPGELVQGRGVRDYPIVIPAWEEGDEISSVSPSSVEFCVGFSDAEDVLDQVMGNGSYELAGGLEFQRFACQVISDPR